jgi:hypothetical protein
MIGTVINIFKIKSKNEKENIEEEEETKADNDIEFLINMMNCQNQTQTEGQESEKIVKIEIISDQNDIDPKSFDIKKRIQDIDVEFQKIQIKEIQICEYEHCKQKISGSNGHLTKGPVSGIRLCGPCYKYESRHNCLIPRSERLKGPVRLESNRLINPICEYCTQTAKWFTKGPVSSMSLCNACYKYEMKYRCLIPRSERLQGPNKNSKIKSKEKDDNFNMKENDVSDFVNDSDTEVEYKLIHVKFDDADEQNNSLLKCPCCVLNKENLVYHIQHFGMVEETKRKYYFFRSKTNENESEKCISGSRNYNQAVKIMQKKNQYYINQCKPVDPFVGENFADIQKTEHEGVYYNRRNKLWYLVVYVNSEKTVLVQEKTEYECIREKKLIQFLKDDGNEVSMCNNLIQEYTNMMQKMEKEREETIFVNLTDDNTLNLTQNKEFKSNDINSKKLEDKIKDKFYDVVPLKFIGLWKSKVNYCEWELKNDQYHSLENKTNQTHHNVKYLISGPFDIQFDFYKGSLSTVNGRYYEINWDNGDIWQKNMDQIPIKNSRSSNSSKNFLQDNYSNKD